MSIESQIFRIVSINGAIPLKTMIFYSRILFVSRKGYVATTERLYVPMCMCMYETNEVCTTQDRSLFSGKKKLNLSAHLNQL